MWVRLPLTENSVREPLRKWRNLEQLRGKTSSERRSAETWCGRMRAGRRKGWLWRGQRGASILVLAEGLCALSSGTFCPCCILRQDGGVSGFHLKVQRPVHLLWPPCPLSSHAVPTLILRPVALWCRGRGLGFCLQFLSSCFSGFMFVKLWNCWKWDSLLITGQ